MLCHRYWSIGTSMINEYMVHPHSLDSSCRKKEKKNRYFARLRRDSQADLAAKGSLGDAETSWKRFYCCDHVMWTLEMHRPRPTATTVHHQCIISNPVPVSAPGLQFFCPPLSHRHITGRTIPHSQAVSGWVTEFQSKYHVPKPGTACCFYLQQLQKPVFLFETSI